MEEELLQKYRNTKSFQKLLSYKRNGKFSHCVLLASEDDVLNKNIAYLFAMSFACESEEKPCFRCANCRKAISETHPDIMIRPQKDDFVVLDATFVTEKSQEKPMLSNQNVFILNNFDRATVQSQNKLLKTIEEPLPNNLYIITSTNLSNILPTIKSRAQIFNLQLNEGLNEELKGESQYLDEIISLMSLLKSSRQIIKYSSSLAEDKNSFLEKLKTMEHVMRDIVFYHYNKQNLMFYDKKYIEPLALEYNEKVCLIMLKKFGEAKRKTQMNVNINLIADSLLLEMMEVKYKYANK